MHMQFSHTLVSQMAVELAEKLQFPNAQPLQKSHLEKGHSVA